MNFKKQIKNELEENIELINQCKKQNPSALEKFFQLYSMEIYNFPIKVFHFDEEQAGDFFLFAFEKLKDGKRFKSFRGESSFRTWFYSVLRNLVIDFIRHNQKSIKSQIYNYESYFELEKNQNISSKNEIQEGIENQFILEKFNQFLQQLDLHSRIVFKLTYIFYLELDETDIKILKETFKKENYEIFEFISESKEYLAKKNLKLKNHIDKLNRMYFKLLSLKEQEKNLKNNIHNNYELQEIQNKIIKKIKNRNYILTHKNLENTLLRVPFHKIAKFLNLTTPTVSSIYHKAEKNLKNSEELKKIFTN